MKLSGVDGVPVDWYGVQGTNGDIGSRLTNSNAVVDRVGQVGLDFGVVLEDRFSANINDAEANVAYLRDHYFNRPEYICAGAGSDLLLMVFGPTTFQTESDWTQILAQAGSPVDFRTLWYEAGDAGANADGEYSWVYQDEALDNYQAHLENFYRYRSRSLDGAAGSAFPGFDDFYEEGGVGAVVPFEIPHEGGQTLQNTLSLASQYSDRVDMLQLVTWNDFCEGTMLEPTVETEFDYLRQLQQFTGRPFGEAELQLVYRLYLARKKYAGDAARQAKLDQASAALSALEIGTAASLLDSAAPLGDYNADGTVDAADYAVWRAAFGTQTILAGGGADGNFDGTVDASDCTVWRDGLTAAAAGSSLPTAVPEPSTLALSILFAAAWPVVRRLALC